jgi:hypothetical protein
VSESPRRPRSQSYQVVRRIRFKPQVPVRCGNEKTVAPAPAYHYAPPPTLGRINNEFSLEVAHAEYARAGVLAFNLSEIGEVAHRHQLEFYVGTNRDV